MNFWTFSIFTLAILINFSNGEVYSSTDELTKLLSNKKDLIDHLKTFIGDLEGEIVNFKR